MLVQDQFGIIQNLQTFLIPQTSFLVGTFLAVSYSMTALADVCFFLQDGNGKVSTDEYQQWYKKVVEVDSDIEDDFEVADFNYFDLDGDGSITMKELITKLNPLASISEKEELAVIVSSAPNFDLVDGNINMREMIAKSHSSAQGNLLRGIVNLSYAA